jgi:hypothetical protein
MGRIILLAIAGALITSCAPKFRCVDGVVYQEYSSGVWIEAPRWRELDKCLNDEAEPAHERGLK